MWCPFYYQDNVDKDTAQATLLFYYNKTPVIGNGIEDMI